MLSNTIKNTLIDKFTFNKQPVKIQKELDTDTDTDTDTDISSIDIEESELELKQSEYTHFLDTLDTDIPNKEYTNIHVCMYKVKTQEMYPFIMFLLYKYENNILNFFKIDANTNKQKNKTTLVNHILDQFKTVFEYSNPEIEYKGFIEDDGDLMIVLKYTNNIHNTITQCSYNLKWWWLLPSEIINYKHVLHLDINSFVTKYLLQHNKLFFLYDKQGNIYETPEVGYYGNYYKRIAAVASLGLSRQGSHSSFGPYYYFSTYKHAMRNALWNPSFKPFKIGDKLITIDENGRYEKGGIVKFALFVGKTKMLLGRQSDTEDDSQISQELAENNAFVKAMLKLRDSNSNWTTEYNSVRIGSHDIKMKDKPVIHTDPLVALKEYEQQVPLEYYYVDTSQDVKEDESDKAIIM